MKRNPFLGIILLLLAATACTGGSRKEEAAKEPQRMEGEAEVNPVVEQLDNQSDSTVMVTLKEQHDDSLVFEVRKTNEKLVLSTAKAQQTGQIKGSLTKGNDYALFPNTKEKSVETLINVSELKGQWFYDMQQHRGMKFEDRGGLSSINVEDISFREWKLLNGRLYIYYLTIDMLAPDRNEYLVEPAEIISLSKEHMTLYFRNKAYECQRQKEVIKMKF